MKYIPEVSAHPFYFLLWLQFGDVAIGRLWLIFVGYFQAFDFSYYHLGSS